MALIANLAGLRTILECGATLSVCKPFSSEQLKAGLGKAMDLMQREHRRYFRYQTDLPANVASEKSGPAPARLINVSEEGVAVSLTKAQKPGGTINLSFELPSIEPFPVEARGEVVWTDADHCVGIKLVYMTGDARRRYKEWLDVLHAQHEFRRPSDKRS